MMTRPQSLLPASLVFLALLMLADTGQAGAWQWTGVPRVVAISDVHGAYPSMVRTLTNAGIVDEALAWQGGQSHLVVTGDLLDRGPQSREAMDLLMRLETQAEAAGGRVHVLLGNHELMNLTGDLRYVSAAEYAAFAAEESAEERDRWYAAALVRNQALSREAFDKSVPPGFFAHRRAFAPDGPYGAWLLGKPIVIVINDTAFVHGGLSPLVADVGLEGINGGMRGRLAEYVEQLAALIAAGYLLPTDGFYERAERLAALPADPARPAEVQAAVEAVIRLQSDAIHETDSPLWYRGNVGCSPLIENARLDAALGAIDAKRVVIGHTPTPNRRVLQRLGGRVIEIDTGMLADYYGGSGHAVVLDGDGVSVISESGGEPAEPMAHPPRVDLPGGELPAHDLAEWLASGKIVASGEESGRTVLTLEQGDRQMNAVFLPNPRTRGLVPELAAYRLDRLIGLDMVPLTVMRAVDGQNGVVQLLQANALDERQRTERGEGASAWCPLPSQWQAMYGFDVLAFNPGRLPDTMLYGRQDWQLMLVSHGNAFVPRNGRPTYLRNAEISLDGAWIRALSTLSNDVLRAELDDVLDRRRLLALYQRRDRLLEEIRNTK